MEFEEHGECADVACECLVVEGFCFVVLGVFCEVLEFVYYVPFCLDELVDVFFVCVFGYSPPIYRLKRWFCHVVHVFCVISMPVIVPVRAVIDANISLFHLPRNAMCAISSVERMAVMATVNFTPVTRRGSGGISRFRLCFVSARLIQSFMVFHFFLASVSGYVGFSAVEEAVLELFCLRFGNVVFGYD